MNPILLFRSLVPRSAPSSRGAWPLVVAGVCLGFVTFGLSACGTARGFGQDVEKVGDKIEDAATR
jgi:predicted small secreted protein